MMALSGEAYALEKPLVICTVSKSKSNLVKCLSTKEYTPGFDISNQWLCVYILVETLSADEVILGKTPGQELMTLHFSFRNREKIC